MGLIQSFKSMFGNTLYYPGCVTKFLAPDLYNNYVALLKKCGVNFIVIPEFKCCGSPAKRAGYADDFAALSQKNRELFKKYNVTRIITNCPGCCDTLRAAGFEAEHISMVLLKNIKKLKIKNTGKISYHDPCHLGRYLGIFDEPRKILALTGFEVVEFENFREKSFCCGAGGGLKTNNPVLSSKIARERLSQAKTDRIVTPCPMCYLQLKEHAGEDKEVYELSQVLI